MLGHAISLYPDGSLFINGRSPKTSSTVYELDGITSYLCGQQRKGVWKWVFSYLHSHFPLWSSWLILLHTHTDLSIVWKPRSSLSLLGCVKISLSPQVKSNSKKKKRKKKVFQVSDYALIRFVWLHLCERTHVHTVWLWGQLIKYSPVHLLHNAVMFLYIECCLQTSSLLLL